jgi:hypothetical protein
LDELCAAAGEIRAGVGSVAHQHAEERRRVRACGIHAPQFRQVAAPFCGFERLNLAGK